MNEKLKASLIAIAEQDDGMALQTLPVALVELVRQAGCDKVELQGVLEGRQFKVTVRIQKAKAKASP